MVCLQKNNNGKNFMKNKNFIWLDEAADMIGVHKTTIVHWIKKKKIINKKHPSDLTPSEKNFRCPLYTRVGSRYRFKREDIEKFIETQVEEE